MPAQERDALDELRDVPAATSSAKPTGTSRRAGQMIRPPALPEISPCVIGAHEDRPRQPHDEERHRQQEEDRAEDVDPGLRARREAPGDHVDAHVLVAQQRVARAEQEDRGEEVPLQLEERVRAVLKTLRTIALPALTSTIGEHQPVDDLADALVQRRR